MKVLITGGAGFIGSHVVDLLLQRQYEVRVLDALLPPVHRGGAIPNYVPQGDIEFIHGDVRDRDAWVQALSGVDSVIHLAAYQDYLPDFSKFFDTNSVGTALLYEVIVAEGLEIRNVVVASSQAAYGEATYECLNLHCPITEKSGSATRFPGPRENAQLQARDWQVRCPSCDQPLQWILTDERTTNPHNSYAISKYTQELIAMNLGERYGIPTACLRYSIVQGPRQSFRNAYSGILRIFSQRILNGQRPVCYEDGGQVRDYLSVLDAAQATLLMLELESEQTKFEVFNVGGDRAVTVLQYARLVAEAAGVSVEPSVPGIYRFGDTRHVVSSVRKLKALRWQPEVNMDDIVHDYLEWATAQPDFRDYSSDAEREMMSLGTLRQAAEA